MTIYAVGDLQGCYDQLQQLLDQIKFDFRCDTLWLTGDLVNRGPRSLEVLRFIKSLGECAVTVLGNHDLHLLAVAYGHEPAKKSDTLDDILAADDKDELLLWLRNRPLLHHDEIRKLTLVHAGMAPQWSIDEAVACARKAEQALRGDTFNDFLANMYGNQPVSWDNKLTGWDRLRFIINCFTRLRYVNRKNELELKIKGSPDNQSDEFIPWFKVSDRKTDNERILFGHWSTLGYSTYQSAVCLDSGCLWGGALTAINVDALIAGKEAEPIRVNCPEQQKPALS